MEELLKSLKHPEPTSFGDKTIYDIENEYKNIEEDVKLRKEAKDNLLIKKKDIERRIKECRNVKHVTKNTKNVNDNIAKRRKQLKDELEGIKDQLEEIKVEEEGRTKKSIKIVQDEI